MEHKKIIAGATVTLLSLAAGQVSAIEVIPVPIYTLQLQEVETADLETYRERLSLEAWDARRNGSLHNPRYKRLQRQISRVESELDQRADAADNAQ